MVQEKHSVLNSFRKLEMADGSLRCNYAERHELTQEYYPQPCVYTFRDMCVNLKRQSTTESHWNADTLINQLSQMKHYAGISTSGSTFKASTAQWVPQPNQNANEILPKKKKEKKKTHTEQKDHAEVVKNLSNSQINSGSRSSQILTERRGGNFSDLSAGLWLWLEQLGGLGLIMMRINSQFQSFLPSVRGEGCWGIDECHENSRHDWEGETHTGVCSSGKGGNGFKLGLVLGQQCTGCRDVAQWPWTDTLPLIRNLLISRVHVK